jgi:hypothetical protein
MIYLLDVNALVALGFLNHEFHHRVASWIRSHNSPNLASCPTTEVGFVPVLEQAPACGFTVAQARTPLLRLKGARPPHLSLSFQTKHDVSHLPGRLKHLSRLRTVTWANLRMPTVRSLRLWT